MLDFLRCAACLACVFFLVSFSNIEAGAPGRQESFFFPGVVRAGFTAVVVVCFVVVFVALLGDIFNLHFHSATSRWATRSGIKLCTNACFTSRLCRHGLLGCMTCLTFADG